MEQNKITVKIDDNSTSCSVTLNHIDVTTDEMISVIIPLLEIYGYPRNSLIRAMYEYAKEEISGEEDK